MSVPKTKKVADERPAAKSGKKLAAPGRRLTLAESLAKNNKRYANLLDKLAK
jgi:hypothetical protein